PLALGLELPSEGTISRPLPRDEAQLELAASRIRPANHLIAPEQRQGVVAEPSLLGRRVRLEAVLPPPEALEAAPIPHHGVERGEQSHCFARVELPRLFARGPEPIDAFDSRMREATAGARDRSLQLAEVLRRRETQPA